MHTGVWFKFYTWFCHHHHPQVVKPKAVEIFEGFFNILIGMNADAFTSMYMIHMLSFYNIHFWIMNNAVRHFFIWWLMFRSPWQTLKDTVYSVWRSELNVTVVIWADPFSRLHKVKDTSECCILSTSILSTCFSCCHTLCLVYLRVKCVSCVLVRYFVHCSNFFSFFFHHKHGTFRFVCVCMHTLGITWWIEIWSVFLSLPRSDI